MRLDQNSSVYYYEVNVNVQKLMYLFLLFDFISSILPLLLVMNILLFSGQLVTTHHIYKRQ